MTRRRPAAILAADVAACFTTRRRELVAALLATAWTMGPAVTQERRKAVVGLLTFGSPDVLARDGRIAAFKDGLRALGYEEGRNFVLEARYAGGDDNRLTGLARELVAANVDVIVAVASPSIRAAQAATQTTPIVMALTGDAVASGLVKSLARPGGNTTGLSNLLADVAAKQLELVLTLLPEARRVGVLLNPRSSTYPSARTTLDAAGQKIGTQLILVDAATVQDIEPAFGRMAAERAAAAIIVPNALVQAELPSIVRVSDKHRLPSIYAYSEFARLGGLISYGPNPIESFRHAAQYVDRILKGAAPGDLPVEQPTEFELVVNAKAAAGLGVIIPPTVLARANEVLE